MESSPYDKSSAESIYDHALKLTGKSLSQVIELPADSVNVRDRGKLGTLVERYYFKHSPPNNHNPDFPEAGVELKVTGVTRSKAGKYKAKERLVLTMINYENIVNESWGDNHFYKKCKKMLILFYLFSKDVPVADRKFIIKPLLYQIPEHDLPVIKADWEKIRNKVLEGKAEELSEGDTFYLGACRKGAGGVKDLRKQPFSSIDAPARAFSFKQNYLNLLISGNQADSTLLTSPEITVEEATQKRFSKFLGKTVNQISQDLNHFKKGTNHKNFHREIATLILANGGSNVREIEKAGIELKTIRLQRNGKPKESMSFPGFDFLRILEENWEQSTFSEKLERKFLFVVFSTGEDKIEYLHKVGYWNMPYSDRKEAERVWLDTQRRVALNAYDLPGMKESEVAHVRPKAKDGNDKALTPQGNYRTKQCFWLNASYIAKVVSELK